MPSQDRSIRNIHLRRKHEHHAPDPAPTTRSPRRKRGRRVWPLALAVVVIAAGLGVLLSTVFAGASVVVTPREANVTLPQSIEAQLNAPVGILPYQTLGVSQSATTTVAAKGSQQVSRQASGTLTITNAYSSAPQRLIANTRFQASDGKIYRITESVVVPGLSGTTPGSATATAYADSPGPDYNRSGDTSYTVPGFKGDPRYAKITATSGAMSGGFVGTEPTVAPADLQTAQQKIEQQLDAAVRAQLTSHVPDGYAVIASTLKVTFGELSQASAGADTAAVSESATASAALVRLGDLAAAVAKQTVADYQGEAVNFKDPGAIEFAATSTQANSLQLVFSGTADLLWVYDPNALKSALLGKQKSEFEAIIKAQEPAIAKATASIRPFWTTTFPETADKITITTAK